MPRTYKLKNSISAHFRFTTKADMEWFSLVSRIIGPIVGRILDLIKQQLYAYVEVSVGAPKPFCLVIVNRANHPVVVERFSVEPDGFPSSNNGLLLNHSRVIEGKKLDTGQRARFYFTSSDFGEDTLREFKIEYSSTIFNWKIPRIRRKVSYDFLLHENTLSVVTSTTLSAYVVDRADS